MQEKISIQELIALNNTQQAKNLIKKYGYKPARNYDDLIQKLYRLTKEYREDGLKEMANLHPHKDLILNYFCVSEPKSKAEGNLNINENCMCPSCQISRLKMAGYSNLSGDDEKTKNNNFDKIAPFIAPITLGLFMGIVLTSIMKSV